VILAKVRLLRQWNRRACPFHLPAADRGGALFMPHHIMAGRDRPAAGTMPRPVRRDPWRYSADAPAADAFPSSRLFFGKAMQACPPSYEQSRQGRRPELHETGARRPRGHLECCLSSLIHGFAVLIPPDRARRKAVVENTSHFQGQKPSIPFQTPRGRRRHAPTSSSMW